ncbi:MAG: hypothetical protein ACREMP_02480 [Candidatus Tyrphobacter sp.]
MADASVESRMAHLEGAFEQINWHLASIDSRFTAIDMRFDAMDRKIDQRFMWTIGVVVGTWVTTMLGILAILARH